MLEIFLFFKREETYRGKGFSIFYNSNSNFSVFACFLEQTPPTYTPKLSSPLYTLVIWLLIWLAAHIQYFPLSPLFPIL